MTITLPELLLIAALVVVILTLVAKLLERPAPRRWKRDGLVDLTYDLRKWPL